MPYRFLSYETKQKIREMVKAGMSKYQTAQNTGVSYFSVLCMTKDMPSNSRGNSNLSQNTVKTLNKLLKDGYITDIEKWQYKNLTRNFPVRMINYKGKRIVFLDDRRESAMKGFLSEYNDSIKFKDFAELARIFNVKLSSNELRNVKKPNMDKTHPRGYNSRITDFLGSFLLSEGLT